MLAKKILSVCKLSYQWFQPLIISVKKQEDANCLKFLIGNETPGDMQICESFHIFFLNSIKESYNFNSLNEAKISPIASELFKFRGVKNININEQSIHVCKEAEASWEFLSPKVYASIRDNFERKIPVIAKQLISEKLVDESLKSTIEDKIQEIILKDIRPEIVSHKGDIKFIDYDEKQGIVIVSLKGACKGCPHASKTLKNFVEKYIKEKIPEVKEIRNIN